MRILPSQAAEAIGHHIPASADANPPRWDYSHAQVIASFLDIVDAVPSELLTVAPAELIQFVQARAALATFLETCKTRGSGAPDLNGAHIVRLRQVLEKCPDRAVPAAVSDLSFILDALLREGLRIDLASIETSLRDADWKPATVMAGSVAEALLLFRLQQDAAKAVATLSLLYASGQLKQGSTDLERLGLHEYTTIAKELGLVKAETATLLGLLKEFRNLIHPGRSIRLKEQCDRGTSLIALGCVLRVIQDVQ